jgi:hypothetical protein
MGWKSNDFEPLSARSAILMTIASFQFEDIGPHFPVEGPYTGGAMPGFKPGTVVGGDQGGEFIFLSLDVVTAYTANQGDMLCWDNTFTASRTGENASTVTYDIGMNVGTFFFGGKTGDNTGSVGAWSVTFLPGIYGIWAQRAGASLANVNAITTLAVPTTATAAPGKLTFLALGVNTNAIAPGSIGYMPFSKTFTADTLTGSTTLLNANGGRRLQKNMVITGSGIPGTTTAPATTIVDINGATITMSAAATATATGVTVTALQGSTSGTTLSGSPVLTGVVSAIGFYPNSNISGTGIPASTSILSITGSPGNYSITMSANATASASNIAFVSTTAPNYLEVMLNWPYFTTVTN